METELDDEGIGGRLRLARFPVPATLKWSKKINQIGSLYVGVKLSGFYSESKVVFHPCTVDDVTIKSGEESGNWPSFYGADVVICPTEAQEVN